MAERPRALGASELYFWRSSRVNHNHFVASAHLEGNFDPGLLVERIVRQAMRHPPLRWTVQDDPDPVFVPLDPAAFEVRVVNVVEADEWESIARAELNRGFKSGGWLFRATLIVGRNSRVILLTFHHAVADGIAGLLLLRAILERQGDATPFPSPEALDDHLQTSAWSKASTALHAINDFFLARPTLMPVAAPIPLQSRTSDFIAHQLTDVQTARLLAWSKCHDVTAHATLCAIVLAASLARVEPGDGLVRSLGCCTPINLRSFLPPNMQDATGCYITSLTTFHRLSSRTPLSTLAMDVKRKLGRAIARNDGPNYISFSKRLGFRYEDEAATERAITRFCKFATSVSNKGRFEISCDDPGMKLVRLNSFSSAAMQGMGTVGLSATTLARRMDLTFVFIPGMVEREGALRFAADVVDRIDSLSP